MRTPKRALVGMDCVSAGEQVGMSADALSRNMHVGCKPRFMSPMLRTPASIAFRIQQRAAAWNASRQLACSAWPLRCRAWSYKRAAQFRLNSCCQLPVPAARTEVFTLSSNIFGNFSTPEPQDQNLTFSGTANGLQGTFTGVNVGFNIYDQDTASKTAGYTRSWTRSRMVAGLMPSYVEQRRRRHFVQAEGGWS